MKTLALSLFLIVCNCSFGQLFGPAQEVSNSVSLATDVHSTDLDGDGDLDVIALASGSQNVAWYENDGDGNFNSQNVFGFSAVLAVIFSADLDGDGDQDVILGTALTSLTWHENDGNGNLGPSQNIPNSYNSPTTIYASDMDGDGDLDLIVGFQYVNELSWFENNGSGGFDNRYTITTNVDETSSVYTADLDGDGDQDVLSSSLLDDKIAWYENDGNGVFGSQEIISVSADRASSVYSADIDGDGDMDVISSSYEDDKIAWYENDGMGGFGSEEVISLTANAVESVYVVDINLDGDLDILSAAASGKTSWYENEGGGSFGIEQVIYSEGGGVAALYPADLDGDGDLDVVSVFSDSDIIVWNENLLGEGCTNSEACNFNSTSWIDNGSCCFYGCGCPDPNAENYVSGPICELRECQYVKTGQVFYDENENGILDGAEYGLPSQTIIVEPSGAIIMTNDEGFFSVNLGSGESILSISNTVYFPFNTTESSVVFNSQNSGESVFLFGVSNEMPLFAVDLDFYPSGNGFLCNDWETHNICFRNLGNVPIDGIVEVEYDELFQGHSEITAIDSVNGNTVYMSFENLLPGQMFFYDISLLTPTVDHIGENITSYARITGFFNGNEVAYGEQELTMEVACAYDPNDKQAFPQGFTEEHYLLQETQQEFLIRFQNTGNAPAQNIRIQDTLDVNFDINSLHIVANSHSVMTTIDPERRLIDFYFENIQLPDSVNNEPESHGLISYRVTPSADLPVGTRLENTAYIYFDNNDPIITNTTWTTIHECGGEANPSLASGVNCEGELVQLSNDYHWIEEYTWRMNGEEFSTDYFAETYLTELGTYEFELEAKNSLCLETATVSLEVDDLTINDPCPGDYNCNGKITAYDLGQFISEYGCFGCLTSDFNEDYSLTAYDLSVFLTLFGTSCVE